MLTLLLLSLTAPRRSRREEAAYREGVADAVDRLRTTAGTHRGRPGDAVRRKVLHAAAEDLDATIGRHAQRRGDL